MKFIKLKVGKKVLNVKDCKGLMSLKGLMFDDIDNHDGALVYGNSLWMLFVKHKLKLIFLDENLHAIDIQDAAPLTLNPRSWRVYTCNKAKYCLETNKNVKVMLSDKVKVVGFDKTK